VSGLLIIFVIPLPQDSYSIVTDASGLGIGGVLQVWRDEKWEAAAFFSRQLRGPEQRYSATELEALALVATVQHFGYYLYRRSFTAQTDHKPLLQLTTSDRLNPRLRRMAFKLQQWLITIEYIPGDTNGFADALSREERSTPGARRLNRHTEEKTSFETELGLAWGDVAGHPPLDEEEKEQG